jgi:hypothetical protein
MNRQLFLEYIKSPEKLNADSIALLEGLVLDYPYCQTASTLYTLNLHKEKNIKYSNSLKKSVAYMSDRTLLKQLIADLDTKDENLPVRTKDAISQLEKVKTEEAIDLDELSISEMIKLLKHKIQIAEHSDIPTEQKEKLPFIASRLNEIIDKYASAEGLKAKNPEKKIVTEYSFDHLGEIESDAEKAKLNQELIDKFIQDPPRISPPPKADFFNPVDIAKHSIIDNEEIVSETLAHIYYEQGNDSKALNIYKKLSLLYPEKSAYFAALIQKIENEVK